MADANNADLDQFSRWYTQKGTPTVKYSSSLDADTFTLNLSQHTATAPENQPFHIPVEFGVIDSETGEQFVESHVLHFKEKVRSCEERSNELRYFRPSHSEHSILTRNSSFRSSRFVLGSLMLLATLVVDPVLHLQALLHPQGLRRPQRHEGLQRPRQARLRGLSRHPEKRPPHPRCLRHRRLQPLGGRAKTLYRRHLRRGEACTSERFQCLVRSFLFPTRTSLLAQLHGDELDLDGVYQAFEQTLTSSKISDDR